MAYKVAIDMGYFYSRHEGGKDEVAYNLLRGFQELGVSDQIVCFCYKPLVPIIREVNPYVGIHVIPKIRTHGYFQEFLFWFRAMYERWQAEKMGVKLFLFPNKPSSNLKYQIPTIEIPHDIEVFENNTLPGVNYSAKQEKVMKTKIENDFHNRDHIIAISDFDKSEMIKFMPWAQDKITRIYNPIRFREKIADPEVEKKYITVLNIQWVHKNVITVLKAFAKLADHIDYDLILVGREGENSEQLRNYVKEQGLEDRVTFTGFVSNERLDEIIDQTRVYVNASFFEGFGMTAVEMIGKEVPTIVAKSTAMPEVTQGLCRYYEPIDDASALAEVLLDELNNPTPREQLHDKSVKLKQIYDYKNIAAQYWAFFDQCIENYG